MDIICKVCNHEINDHLPDGCFHCENGTQSVNDTCSCGLSPADVANVEITLLQARLDTNRAQVEALIAERDALKRELAKANVLLAEGYGIVAQLRQERSIMLRGFEELAKREVNG